MLEHFGTIFAYFSISIVSFGDFSRYIKDEKNLKKGNLSLIVNLVVFSFAAVFIVVGSDIFLNQKFEDINQIFIDNHKFSSQCSSQINI